EKNKLKAYVELIAPMGEGKPCTLEDVKQALAKHNIVKGIKEKDIQEMISQNRWGQKFLVAEGKPPVNGENAKIVYKFPLLSERIGPKIDEDDRANYHDLGLIFNVKMGQLLAEKIPATPG